MTEWHAGSKTLWIGDRGWKARPLRQRGETYAIPLPADCTAEVYLRRDGLADLSLWTGEPGASDGVAVLEGRERPVALSAIPLCSCGDRGCGNAGIQLVAVGASDVELVQMLDAISGLRWRGTPPNEFDTLWQPELKSTAAKYSNRADQRRR